MYIVLQSDGDDAVLAPPPSPQAQPHFERDPMLDRLFAEEQNKKEQQKQEQQQHESMYSNNTEEQ